MFTGAVVCNSLIHHVLDAAPFAIVPSRASHTPSDFWGWAAATRDLIPAAYCCWSCGFVVEEQLVLEVLILRKALSKFPLCGISRLFLFRG